MVNKLRNFGNKIRELGIREGMKFYLNNLLFGEQVNFNTKFLIIFLLKDYFNFKEKRIKEFFGPDTSFFNKMNVPASYLYDNCRKGNVKFLKHKSFITHIFLDHLSRKYLISFDSFKIGPKC